MSIFGPSSMLSSTLTEAERYTREADQARLATEAMMKLGRSANRMAQTERAGLGNTTKSGEESK
jgi:hypothetical protein